MAAIKIQNGCHFSKWPLIKESYNFLSFLHFLPTFSQLLVNLSIYLRRGMVKLTFLTRKKFSKILTQFHDRGFYEELHLRLKTDYVVAGHIVVVCIRL